MGAYWWKAELQGAASALLVFWQQKVIILLTWRSSTDSDFKHRSQNNIKLVNFSFLQNSARYSPVVTHTSIWRHSWYREWWRSATTSAQKWAMRRKYRTRSIERVVALAIFSSLLSSFSLMFRKHFFTILFIYPYPFLLILNNPYCKIHNCEICVKPNLRSVSCNTLNLGLNSDYNVKSIG
jgi:hypothetical protein